MDVALALGGGGVKGIAHLGVLTWLESHGYHVRAIAGTSAGGLVGSVYAAGNSPLEILKAVQHLDFATIFKRRAEDGPSILGHAGLVQALSVLLKDITFENLKIPFACTAVDINSSREVYLTSGSFIDSVLATMAIPGILPPIQAGGALLVDGGVLDPVPVLLARLLAPQLPILAVVLSPAEENWGKVPETTPLPIPAMLQSFSHMRIGQALRIFAQSLDINTYILSELRLQNDKPDVIIRPDVYEVGLLEFAEPLDLVQAGIEAAETSRRQIQSAVSTWGSIRRSIRHLPVPKNANFLEIPHTSKRDSK